MTSEWAICLGILALVLICTIVWLCGIATPGRYERHLQREVREAVNQAQAWRNQQ